jgi:hypothetical protein
MQPQMHFGASNAENVDSKANIIAAPMPPKGDNEVANKNKAVVKGSWTQEVRVLLLAAAALPRIARHPRCDHRRHASRTPRRPGAARSCRR